MESINIEPAPKYSPTKQGQLMARYLSNPTQGQDFINHTCNINYYYWDKVKYLSPIPDFTIEESWIIIKNIRKSAKQPTPILSQDGAYFSYYRPQYLDEYLSAISAYSQKPQILDTLTEEISSAWHRYLSRGIREESIASSQIEGANTSKDYAKRMLAEQLKPRNTSEQMILNNYNVMKDIAEFYKDQQLSKSMLKVLQAELVKDTLSPEFTPGEFRKDADQIVVVLDDKIAYTPPTAAFVAQELDRLVEFANSDEYIHPVIKAIELHFWIAYLHPFPDGNGRLARALFYWYLCRCGYSAIDCIPISTVIKRSQSNYAYSYIYSEKDDHDFTYFLDYNIKRIKMAIDEFETYVKDSYENSHKILDSLASKYPSLNERQLQSLQYLLQNKENYTTIISYADYYNITTRTAFTDIKELVELNLLAERNEGKRIRYYAGKIKLPKLTH